jgi:ABC-type multidrug transport system fused ATPase/permease subunit
VSIGVVSGLIEGRVSALRVYAFLKAAEFGQEEEEDAEEPAAKDWTVLSSPYRSPTRLVEEEEEVEHVSKQPHDPKRCVICIQGTFDYVLPNEDAGKSVAVDVSSSSSSSPAASVRSPPLHALEDLHLHVYSGECIGIHGSVGAAKSTLLLGMLGELSQRSKAPGDGRHVFGRVAFVSQEVWLPNATVRDQILFHSPFNAERYARVIHACALQPDLDVFPASDLTEVGEASINISGGQSMRLSLARACYSQADIFYFDDPLSSVEYVETRRGANAQRQRYLWRV